MALCNSVVPQLNLSSMLYQFRSSPIPTLVPHRTHITSLTARARGHTPVSRSDDVHSKRFNETAVHSAQVADDTNLFPAFPSNEDTTRQQGKWKRSADGDRALLSSIQ